MGVHGLNAEEEEEEENGHANHFEAVLKIQRAALKGTVELRVCG